MSNSRNGETAYLFEGDSANYCDLHMLLYMHNDKIYDDNSV